jgi:hypothetical protein
MKLTHDGLQQQLIHSYFSQPKLGKNPDAEMTLFFKFGLYFALFIIALKLSETLVGFFDSLKNYTSTLQRILLNSYDYFIIVSLILFYLLRNKSGTFWLMIGFDVKNKAPLFGFWFIFGRVIYATGYLLTTLTGLNLKVPGVALTYFTITLMIA